MKDKAQPNKNKKYIYGLIFLALLFLLILFFKFKNLEATNADDYKAPEQVQEQPEKKVEPVEPQRQSTSSAAANLSNALADSLTTIMPTMVFLVVGLIFAIGILRFITSYSTSI